MKKTNTAARYYRHMCLVFGVIAALYILVFGGIAVIFYVSGESGLPFLIAMIPVALLFLVPMAYALTRYLHYRDADFTDVQRVRLGRTDSLMRAVGFEIEVVQGGKRVRAVTKRVFGVAPFSPNRLDDYAGETAEVGYDEARDEWIVL